MTSAFPVAGGGSSRRPVTPGDNRLIEACDGSATTPVPRAATCVTVRVKRVPVTRTRLPRGYRTGKQYEQYGIGGNLPLIGGTECEEGRRTRWKRCRREFE